MTQTEILERIKSRIKSARKRVDDKRTKQDLNIALLHLESELLTIKCVGERPSIEYVAVEVENDDTDDRGSERRYCEDECGSEPEESACQDCSGFYGYE